MKSPLEGWHDKAGVRVDPRRVLGAEVADGRTLFPEKLIPYLAHPHMRSLDPDEHRRVVARHLYQYLQFTTHFETRVVNRATERIANGTTGLDLDPSVRLDAYKIYCDEAYHALYSYDVVAQVEEATRIEVPDYDFTPFLNRLDDVGRHAMPEETLLVQLLQVVVFETLVTALLKDIPNDPRVVDVVRETVRDHAEDEGRHHIYFSRFFKELWTDLGTGMRRKTAHCLPELIHRSLAPDLAPVRRSLELTSLAREEIDAVLADCYPAARVSAGIRTSARHSIRLFESVGVLDIPGAREAFECAGLR
jgi:hypothetical protein